MDNFALNEVFYKAYMVSVRQLCSFTDNVRSDLMKERVLIHGDYVKQNGGIIENFVGFIYGTKIKTARQIGPNSHQIFVYSGQKRFHCLTYQTITIHDNLIFKLFRPLDDMQPDSYL